MGWRWSGPVDWGIKMNFEEMKDWVRAHILAMDCEQALDDSFADYAEADCSSNEDYYNAVVEAGDVYQFFQAIQPQGRDCVHFDMGR
jgi:hypothetical protein